MSRDTGPLTCRQRQLRQQRVPGQPQGQVRGVPQVPGALPLLQQHQETQQTLRGHQPLWDRWDTLEPPVPELVLKNMRETQFDTNRCRS